MRKNKLFYLGLLVLLLFANLVAFSYPVRKIFITSLFGESRGDHFHNGLDFAREKDILAIKEGEVLFYSDKMKNPLTPRWGVGGFMSIEHPDKIRSYYYHLKEETINHSLSTIAEGDKLAEMGNSGRSLGAHLHLTIYDYERKKMINPYEALPKINDDKNPKITSLLFRIKNKTYKIKNNSKLFYFGPVEIIVIAGDYRSKNQLFLGNNIIGLKSLTLFIDNKFFKKYHFGYLEELGNDLVTSDGDKIENVYGLSHNYKFGLFEIQNPSHTFEILAEDRNGNVSSTKKKVYFRVR